jgi:PPIC-type PPIASE domain/SurA N-terminal domain
MSIMAPQHVVSRPPRYAACIAHQRFLAPQAGEAQLERECRGQYDALRREALGFLISEKWLTEEAAEEGLRVSEREVKQQLDRRRRSFSSDVEFWESLRAIDHSISDVELEIRAELAAQKLRQRLIDNEPKLTQAQIASYYRRNIGHFYIPTRRYFNIVENLKSEAAARKLSREFAQGKASIVDNSLHESLAKGALGSPAEHRIIYKAIFAAKPRVLTQPILINHRYFLVEVTRITPARLKPLSEVQDAIKRKLTSEHQRQTLAAFIKAWRARWSARTDCSPGYVIQKCRQYNGPATPEPLSLK